MKHIVSLSGGVGSFIAACRVVAEHGTKDTILCFTDTLIEDPDLYRFLDDVSAYLKCEFVRLADGRTPWQVFRDVRFLGNTRVDPCSKILKRDLFRKWLTDRFGDAPDQVRIYLGIDWTEINRFERAAARWLPWVIKAPLCAPPYLSKAAMFKLCEAYGIKVPSLYAHGFVHNNCGGGCIKAGHSQWRLLLKEFPERYAQWQAEEEEFRKLVGKDVAILRDEQGRSQAKREGNKNWKARPLTLRELKERAQAGEQGELFAIGGCGCFL